MPSQVATTIAEFTAIPAAAEDDRKIALLCALEGQLDEPDVVALFLAALSDPDQYDLARVECAKILHIYPPTAPETRVRAGRAMAAVLRDTDADYLVRQYVAMGLSSYLDDPEVFDAAETTVRTTDDEIIKANVLFSLEWASGNARAATLVREIDG
jgi:hypothetical protein